MKSSYVRIALGTVLIERSTYYRIKKICGYTKEDIKQTIIQNGEESLYSSVDSMDLCEHNLSVAQGHCCQCNPELE